MIESVNNEKIIKYSKLNNKKYREEYGLFLVEGEHLVKEAVNKGLILEIFLLNGEIKLFDNTTFVTYEVLKKLTSLKTPPKIIAVCQKLKSREFKGNIVMLDNISDPGNLGTIIRSAVAFNYETIILSPNTVDLYNPKVIRATEGMLFNINIIIADLTKSIQKLKNENYLIVGTDVKNGQSPRKISKKHALIIGSEGKGVNKNILALTDYNLYIKMNSLCESLNAGVSASILMNLLNM